MATKYGRSMQEVSTYIINSRILYALAGFIPILINRYVLFCNWYFAIYQRRC